MGRVPDYEHVASLLTQIGLRIVLARQATGGVDGADDRIHQSVDRGSDRLLPRRTTETLSPTRD